jgi:hypothetical protein
MGCQTGETSIFEAMRCDNAMWPMAHAVYPFFLAVFTGEYRLAIMAMYIYESFEASFINYTGSYQWIAPGSPAIPETLTNSIILDPFMGFCGILLAYVVRSVCKSPMFRHNADGDYYVLKDRTGDLVAHFYEKEHGPLFRFFANYSPFTVNGRWVFRQIVLFMSLPLSFIWMDYTTKYFNGTLVCLFVIPTAIMLHAWWYSDDYYQRQIVFDTCSDRVYWMTYFKITCLFASTLLGTIILKAIDPTGPTSVYVIVIGFLQGTAVLVGELLL